MIRTAARLLAATVLLVPLLLATVAVAPAMAGGGCHGIDGTVHTEGPSTVVRMDVCSYAPTVVHVPVGTEVRFLNTAQVDHLVVGESRTWGTETELAPGEAQARRTGRRPGPISTTRAKRHAIRTESTRWSGRSSTGSARSSGAGSAGTSGFRPVTWTLRSHAWWDRKTTSARK